MKRSLIFTLCLTLLASSAALARPTTGRSGSIRLGRTLGQGSSTGSSTSMTGPNTGVGPVPANFSVPRPRRPRGTNSSYYYGYGRYRMGGAPAPSADDTFKNSTHNRIPGYESDWRRRDDSFAPYRNTGSSGGSLRTY